MKPTQLEKFITAALAPAETVACYRGAPPREKPALFLHHLAHLSVTKVVSERLLVVNETICKERTFSISSLRGIRVRKWHDYPNAKSDRLLERFRHGMFTPTS